MAFKGFFPALAIAFALLALPIYGQISMPCTSSMITSFTPCLNFITNSTANGTSPTADCCNVLKSFTTNGTDCLCLIATGSVPFQIPINRTLALSLPRACNMPGVPLQCKASASPLPAPAPSPFANAPSLSPQAAPSPKGSIDPEPTLAPEAETPPTLTPTTPAANAGPTTQNTGNRQSLTPSAASTQSFSPFLMLVVLGAAALKYY